MWKNAWPYLIFAFLLFFTAIAISVPYLDGGAPSGGVAIIGPVISVCIPLFCAVGLFLSFYNMQYIAIVVAILSSYFFFDIFISSTIWVPIFGQEGYRYPSLITTVVLMVGIPITAILLRKKKLRTAV